jgi:hypothetical protein
MTPEVWQVEINKTPLKDRAEYKRSVIEHGLDSEFVADALGHHRKLLSLLTAHQMARDPGSSAGKSMFSPYPICARLMSLLAISLMPTN